MKNCYYLRHGRTDFSEKSLFAGRQDIPILPCNLQELAETGECLLSKQIELIVYSPLMRVKQTIALFVNLGLNVKNKIELPQLIERDFGFFEGKPKTEENRRLLLKCNSVEPEREVMIRAVDVRNLILRQDATTLIVGHSHFYRFLRLLAANNPPENIKCFQVVELQF